jgi:hypothetical protein
VARGSSAEARRDAGQDRLLVYRLHLASDHELLSGYREGALPKVNGVWKLRTRTIVLDANVLLKNLSVFLQDLILLIGF